MEANHAHHWHGGAAFDAPALPGIGLPGCDFICRRSTDVARYSNSISMKKSSSVVNIDNDPGTIGPDYPMEQDRFITVYFLDGSDVSITFPKQPGNPLLMAKRVQSALDADQFTIEVDGELMMIPKSSVKYMTVSPLPEEMPDTIIRGGKIVVS